ncbi:MAG: DoxX family membrane protein [Cyclobacteriaceae bacterium]|nr:DoxX family membrane protein [Cyclobacteriaceae bacterium]
MKIAIIIVRTLLGMLFVFGSLAYFFSWIPQPELTGDLKTFNDGLNASGYLMPLIKFTELVCGIAFIAGRFVPLAVIIIFPIVINIVSVHIFLAPEGLPIALFLLLTSLFLAYSNRDHYKSLLVG